MFKRLYLIFLLLVIAFSLTSCNAKPANKNENNFFVSSDKAFTPPSSPEVTVSVPSDWE